MLTSSGNTLTDTPRNHVYADISISHGPVKLTHKIKSQDTLNGCWGVESGVGHLAALNCFALLHDFLFYSLADTFEVQGFGLSLFPWLLAFSFLFFFFKSTSSAIRRGWFYGLPRAILTLKSLLTIRAMQTCVTCIFLSELFPNLILLF